MPQIVWAGQSGCLLPLLIILNLLFGRAFFNSIYLWLGIEAVLVLIFIVKIHIFMKRILQQVWPQGHGSASSSRSRWPGVTQNRVVDVEGKVVEEKKS